MAHATASATSISTSSYASAFRLLFEATERLELLSSRASTAFFTPATSITETVSQVTVNDGSSQITVMGRYPVETSSSLQTAPTVVEGATPGGERGDRDQARTGLPKDPEGVETRKQILARRRKECAAEEVDVALAPVMKINVPYCFYPEQYKNFRKMFPRVNVDSGLSFTHHDHPVAHTATMVGIRYMQSMLRPSELALDLHGNPNGNEQFNRFQSSRWNKRPHLPRPPIIETLVEEKTSADAVRRITKWGNEFDEHGVRRFYEQPVSKITPGVYDTFLSVHTLYYYSMYEVCKLMSKNPKSRMMALVNYTKEQTGTLYGELKYHKVGGMTTQTSPNGETYRHPDIDQWFQTNSFRPHTDPFNAGIAWTSHHVGGPLYVIVVTRCDYELARTPRYDPPGAPTLTVQKDRSFLGFARIGGKDIRLRITNADLANELRHFMVFRDRSNPQVFQDLVVKARRCTSPDIVDGSRQYHVADGDLQDHIVYAFLVDAPGEKELLDGVAVLKADILDPLAQGLKLEGSVETQSLVSAIFQVFTGPKATKTSLGQSKVPRQWIKSTNTGGLLPAART